MKLSALFIVLLAQSAWPQVETGSVLFFERQQNELTVATDSRVTGMTSGRHEDAQCKISAFGPQFVFSSVGIASKGENGKVIWDAFDMARRIWRSEAKTGSTNTLVARVADKWTIRMVKALAEPSTIQAVRKRTLDGALASAVFANTAKSDPLVVEEVEIGFDVPLFDSTHKVRITHSSKIVLDGSYGFGGHGEIAVEFLYRTSERGKDFYNRFTAENSSKDSSTQRAILARELVELSVQLHPNRIELGLPADVLQLKGGGTVQWRWVKQNCPQK